MNREAMREALLPHAKRPIRAFLRAHSIDADTAFWNFVYSGIGDVTHATAKAVANELEQSPHTVGQMLSGWRPAALGRST